MHITMLFFDKVVKLPQRRGSASNPHWCPASGAPHPDPQVVTPPTEIVCQVFV